VYFERLQTPHDRYQQEEQGLVILSQATRDVMDSYEESSKTHEDNVTYALEAAEIVRRTLNFKRDTRARPYLSPENLETDKSTNCYGYTIVASELLEHIGIPHYVAYANGHAFVLLHDEAHGKSFMIDSVTKELNMDISDMTSPESRDTSSEAFSFQYLDGMAVLENAGFDDIYEATMDNLWLTFADNRLMQNWTLRREDFKRKSRIIMTTFPPSQGRPLLQNYNNFIHAGKIDDVGEAYDLIQEMDGMYPEIDRRNRFRLPEKLVKELVRAGLIVEALSVAGVVDKSIMLSGSKDADVRCWPADMYYLVGQMTENKDIVRSALQNYEMVESEIDSDNTRLRDEVELKIEKAKVLIDKLTSPLVD
jgi:hypothetical protein